MSKKKETTRKVKFIEVTVRELQGQDIVAWFVAKCKSCDALCSDVLRGLMVDYKEKHEHSDSVNIYNAHGFKVYKEVIDVM